MRKHGLPIRATVMSFTLLLLLISVGCFHFGLTSLADAAQVKRVIMVEAKELTLNYSQEIYWDEQQFDQEYVEYSADKAGYLRNLAAELMKEWGEAAYYSVEATDWAISFRSEYELEAGKATYLALIRCKVEGPASGTVDNPRYAFEWLLKPIFGASPDLYGFEYTADGTTLVYEGQVDHIPIAITLIFPQPIDHCHYHVWYRG